MFLPHITAFTIELKLSSNKIIAADYRATSVPAIPIANPTSAFFSAGASFVPSPVTATTSPRYFSPVTKAYLSYGLDLARTSKLSFNLSNSSALAMVSTLKSFSFYYASLIVLAQSHNAVLHFLHTTPPISLINSAPSMTSSSSWPFKIPTSLAMALAVTI
jgi:hypothetical protein